LRRLSLQILWCFLVILQACPCSALFDFRWVAFTWWSRMGEDHMLHIFWFSQKLSCLLPPFCLWLSTVAMVETETLLHIVYCYILLSCVEDPPKH
jgi:hypothetical protein